MSINKFRRLVNADNNDLLYIIDTSGNRPITKLITTSDLLAYIASEIDIPPAYIPPTSNTKTISLSISGNSYQTTELDFGAAFILSKVTASFSNIRVRLYLNQGFANTDINRAIGSNLPISHGLIYDAVFSGSVTALDVLPSAIATPNQNVTLVVNNLLGDTQNISLAFTYIPLF